MDVSYYVYALLDSSKPGLFTYGEFKFEYEPFYVGKGKGKRIKETIYDKSCFKRNKINKLKKDDIKIISIKVIDSLTNEEAILKEIYIISLIGRRDLKLGPLVNTTDGGDGRNNSKHSDIVKEKISNNRRGKGIGWKHKKETLIEMSKKQIGDNNNFYGKTHSHYTKKEQSERVGGLSHPMFGKKHDKETIDILVSHRRENISNSKIKESCQKFNKSVLVYDLDFVLIKEFESVKIASEETGINESIISKCCRGDIKYPTRYFFRYKDDSDNIKENKYLIDIDQDFKIGKEYLKLKKRNKETCICEINGEKVTKHKDKYEIIFRKETNNINITELYIYLKSIDKDFKIEGDIIYNKSIKIRYVKLLENSELFLHKKDYSSDILIFEDEWKNKKDIVKSRLLNITGGSTKIWARNCQVKEVNDNKILRDFLVKNHIQGFVGSRIKIGLFYKDELISLMTFGNLRKSMGQNSEEGTYELLRFCNKLNHSVVGGGSKLFKYFLLNFNPIKIISYADKRWSKGNLYNKIGFVKTNDTINNYYWIVNDNREYRFKWRKDILVKKGYDENMTEVEIMNSLGYFRIFDKGNIKFEFINKP